MKVYVVMGSEDGYCGTYTSKKKAMAYGVQYILNGGDATEEGIDTNVYDHGIYMYGPNGTNVEIIIDEISR